jgi:hypothetical protein
LTGEQGAAPGAEGEGPTSARPGPTASPPRQPGPAARVRWLLVATAGLAVIARVTLVATHGPDSGRFHWCMLCGGLGLADFLSNVVLFVPLAAGLRGAGVSGRITVALGAVLSLAVELAQLHIPGRESAFGDVVANTAGAALGACLLPLLWRRQRSMLGGAAASAATLAVVVFGGLVLRPSFPPSSYYGQWTARLRGFARYEGRVMSARIGDLALPPWRLPDSPAVRRLLRAGVPVRVRAVAGPRPAALAPLFSIYDGETREILLVGPDRDDLVLRVRTRAADLRLAPTELRWPAGLADVRPGDSLAVEIRRGRSGYCLALNGLERCGLGLTAGALWALLRSVPHLPARARAALDCLFLALLGLPAGLLLPRRAASLLVAGLLVAGMVLLPPLIGLTVTPPLQLAAFALGIAGGVLFPERAIRTLPV